MAVLVDVTIVRVVIGSALLQLAGRWNWWPGNLGPQRSEWVRIWRMAWRG